MSLKILSIYDVLNNEIIKFFHDLTAEILPIPLNFLCKCFSNAHDYNLRNDKQLLLPKVNTTNFSKNSLRFHGASVWNDFLNKYDDKKVFYSKARLKNYLKKIALKKYE